MRIQAIDMDKVIITYALQASGIGKKEGRILISQYEALEGYESSDALREAIKQAVDPDNDYDYINLYADEQDGKYWRQFVERANEEN